MTEVNVRAAFVEPTKNWRKVTDVFTRLNLYALSDTELEDLCTDIASFIEFRRNPNSISAQLAAMAPGESRIFPQWTNARRLQTADRRNARKRLDEPEAQWAGRSTNQGVRVTRTR